MCYQPITIPNPSRRFVKGAHRPQVTVACGQCKECHKKMQDSWIVRSCFEFKRCVASGGSCWFPTLTYSNENLPKWYDALYDYEIPCFDRTHFKRFRDRLRVYLKRLGYDFTGENTIRFIYCCEYGGKYGRSHIHCALFVPQYIPFTDMREVIKKAWPYGYVQYSKRGMMLQNNRGLRYLMKYISKDMHYSKKYDIDGYLEKLKTDMANASDEETKEYYHDVIKSFRRCLPHHGQSLGFGESGIQYFMKDGKLDYDRLYKMSITANELGIPVVSGREVFEYQIPSYYLRKLLYDYDRANNLYTKNEHYRKVMYHNFDIMLQRNIDKFRLYFSSPELFIKHVSIFSDEHTQEDLYDMHEALHRIIRANNIGLQDIAIFDMVYKDIAITDENRFFAYESGQEPHRSTLFYVTPEEHRKFLLKNALSFYNYTMMATREPDPVADKIENAKYINGFNELDAFRGFRNVITLISSLEKKLGKCQQDAYYHESEIQSNAFLKNHSDYITL